eukprot:Phypoly_transcript_02357.p1 GENE.Phypoly_transcript_02357~~Phypoly_transcript_02357.p1  ORF type:complete len:783 (+),score=185.54 Phypoly_transcript_02357:207-2555(+)
MLKTCTMTTIVDYHTENASKRRKFDYTDGESMECSLDNNGWNILQPILENEVLCAKIPTSNVAFDLLAKWFQIIAGDQEKLRVFRQWIMTSSDGESATKKESSPSPTQLVPTVKLADKKSDTEDEPSTDAVPSSHPLTVDSSPSKVASIDFINNEIPITPRSTPQVLLLQQLLQKQQQQIVILQKLQPGSENMAVVPTANSITLTPTSGSAGVVLTAHMSMKNSPQWHAFSDVCTCTCGFTTQQGSVTIAQRVAGGGEGEMRFVVPPIAFPSQDVAQIQMAVHLTSCAAPHAPLVCADSFMYSRERASLITSSDEDFEDSPESSVCGDEDENDEDVERDTPAPSASPKQLMTVRERMLDFVHSGAASKGVRVTVLQSPPNRVVWKNRRLDTPFKVRVEGAASDIAANKLAVLALVVDHKGKLQIDAMENFDEECSLQGLALFHNLRMTKGTWGKEWSITFVVVTKSSLAGNNPVVVGVSQACPVVVKTRKNPQVRHINRSDSPSPIAFVESSSRKPDTTIRKRNRLEDILDAPASNSSPSLSSSSSSTRTGTSHSEAMSNLLYAAEIKQQEREFRPPLTLPAVPSSAPSSPPRSSMVLPSLQGGFGSPDPNFANLQGLLGYLEEIKIKHHPSLSIVEQPQLKRDGKVLIVKKGKPFRTPFRLQMRTSPLASHGSSSRANYNSALDYNPQQYVCVAVLRNDKGEEVALKNSEVLFDARGLATFSGLMVMKGTWGKSVQLTFEARWSGARRIVGGSNWPPLRMLVVSETPALQLMCYTKDKKNS